MPVAVVLLVGGLFAGCRGGTDPARDVGALTAQLRAHGRTSDSPGRYFFQYATSEGALGTAAGRRTPTRGPVPPNYPADGSEIPFGEDVGGLTPATRYFFRVCGGDAQVDPDVCTDTQSFTTAATPAYRAYPTAYGPDGPRAIVTGPDGALWFLNSNAGSIGRMSRTGETRDFQVTCTLDGRCPVLPTLSGLNDITVGPDGALWFTGGDGIGRITTSGSIRTWRLPGGVSAREIATGSDGALWFVDQSERRIGRFTTSGALTFYGGRATTPSLTGITAGPDGALWFTNGDKVGRMTTGGAITQWGAPAGTGPTSREFGDIVTGPDGRLWFAQFNRPYLGYATTTGGLGEVEVGVTPRWLTSGPDGAVWFTSASPGGTDGRIGRTTTDTRRTTVFTPERLPTEPGGIAAGPDGAVWYTAPDDRVQSRVVRAG